MFRGFSIVFDLPKAHYTHSTENAGLGTAIKEIAESFIVRDQKQR